MNREYRIDYLFTSVFIVIAFYLKTHTFLDMDVAWHVEGAKRLLAGSNYLTAILDDNAPPVFIFFIPVILLNKLLHLSFALLIPLYILLWNSFSLGLLYWIIQKTMPIQEPLERRALYYTCLFIILFLPLINFGQREIILLNFFLPYFIILIFSPDEQTLSKFFIIACVILASFGIMQNLLYLIAVIVVEVYHWCKYRKIAYFQLVFYLAIAIQILICILVFPEYFKTVLPLIACYEPAFNSSWSALLTPAAWGCLLILVLVSVNLKKIISVPPIMMSSLISFCTLLIYFFEKKNWFYHLYPALAFALILNTFLFLILMKKIMEQGKKSGLRLVLSMAITLVIGVCALGGTIRYSAIFMNEYANPDHPWNKWIQYANRNFKNKKLFFFIVYYPPSHMLPLYTNNEVVSPWFNAWFLPYFLENDSKKKLPICNPEKDLQLFYTIFTASLKETAPDYVLISTPPPKQNALLNNFQAGAYFQPQNLRKQLSEYSWYAQYDEIAIYKKR